MASPKTSGNGSGTKWTSKQPMVSIKDLHKSFGDLEVLKGVSMDVMKGDCVCIIDHRPLGVGQVHADPVRECSQRHPVRLYSG